MEYVVCDNRYSTVKDVLIKEFHFSKRLILKLKKENKIFVNNLSQFVNFNVKINDVIKIDLNFSEECDNIIPTKLDLNIIYEDDWLLILNKSAKIETHPTAANNSKTLSNGVKFYFDSIDLKRKIRPVNRLDKDTSGIIVFAKNQYVQEELVKQMKDKTFEKKYIAIVEGIINKNNTQEYSVIEAKIARKSNSILERCVDDINGVYAKTFYKVIQSIEKENITVVELKLETRKNSPNKSTF